MPDHPRIQRIHGYCGLCRASCGTAATAAQQRPPALGTAEHPLGPARSNVITARELYRAILEGTPYPVRGLIGFGSNMLLSQADGDHGRVASAALDLYAHAALFMTPTAALADVVLPVASAFEREGLKIGFEISAEAQAPVQFRPVHDVVDRRRQKVNLAPFLRWPKHSGPWESHCRVRSGSRPQ